jgi:hypothetical protein
MLASIGSLYPRLSSAQQVAVKYKEGVVHGFLVIRTLNDETIAAGDLAQLANGDRVTTHLVYHFKDGSLQEETAVFSQRGSFRLITDHLIQKGPAFKRPTDLSIDGSTGQVRVRYTDDDGKEKVITDRLKIPPDLANGAIPTVLKNIPPGTPKTTLSMIVATSKPRLVKLIISPEGEDTFSVGESARKAVRRIHTYGFSRAKLPPSSNRKVQHMRAVQFGELNSRVRSGRKSAQKFLQRTNPSSQQLAVK